MKNGILQNLSYEEKEAIEEAALNGVSVTINGKNGTYMPNQFYAMGATHLDELPAFRLEASDLYERSIASRLDESELTAEERNTIARPAAYALRSVGSSLKKAYHNLKDRLTSRDVHDGIEAAIKAYVEQ